MERPRTVDVIPSLLFEFVSSGLPGVSFHENSLSSLLILCVNWRDRDNLLTSARHAVHPKSDGWTLHLYSTLVCVAERAALNFS